MKKDFRFSVIMPIYNTGPYLAEAIDSIIQQTIGFEEWIQLILVNDGSPDNAHEICMEYQAKYPDNIIYLDQENRGVSFTRNHGLSYATGKYVNFFDSDDIWNLDVFQIVYDFFEAHVHEIDAVSCIQDYFEAKSGLHSQSKKFEDGDRVIDIHETPQFILLNVTSVFIKTDVARHYEFDTEISIGEDSKYITEVIFEKEKYGVLKSAVYHIRKRHANNSLTQAPSPLKYTKTMDRYYKQLPILSEQKFGKVIPYIQYALINGLKFRVRGTSDLPLTPEEKAHYIETVISLIRDIDDKILLTTNGILLPMKLYLLRLKYGVIPEDALTIQKNRLYFRSILVGNLSLNRVQLHHIEIRDNICTIGGVLIFPLEGAFDLEINENGKRKVLPLTDTSEYHRYAFNKDVISCGKTFQATLSLEDHCTVVSFDVNYKGTQIPQKPLCKESIAELKHEPLRLGNYTITLQERKLYIEKG